jgi:hypothetical protein
MNIAWGLGLTLFGGRAFLDQTGVLLLIPLQRNAPFYIDFMLQIKACKPSVKQGLTKVCSNNVRTFKIARQCKSASLSGKWRSLAVIFGSYLLQAASFYLA